jgi:hypothetical protein
LYGDLALLKAARGRGDDIETTSTFRGKRSKAMTPNCPATSLAPMSITETMSRIQQGLKLDPAQLAAKLSPELLAKYFAQCGLVPPAGDIKATDAKRLLSCRFGLPFEKTRLNSLTTSDDPDFFSRLMKNPNLPKYLQALPAYYRQ